MDTAIGVIESLLIQNYARRIAATLLRVMPPPGDEGEVAPAEVILTQSQLGEMASLGRQVVNRELRRMEASGWLAVSYHRIKVLAPDAVARFAQDGLQSE